MGCVDVKTKANARDHFCQPGGKRVVVVATLDNLLKGAATQAMQNLNLALGIDELTSIPH